MGGPSNREAPPSRDSAGRGVVTKLPPAPATTAREWAYASWDQPGEGLTVSAPALQALLDEVAHLRALGFAAENRIKVTVEAAGEER